MTVHRGQNMKREDQQDATIRCLLLTSVSTCFRHHYAHLPENKDPVTAFGVSFCNERENADISRDVFFVGVACSKPSWDFVCVYANVVCKWVCRGVGHVETEVNNKHLIVASCWFSLFIFW